VARVGALPDAPAGLIATLRRSDVRGRGGAGFPVASKWESVANRRGRRPVVLVNGAEGEPLSRKDRLLMETRPHLVLDGAALAAGAVDAGKVIVYVGGEHAAARAAMLRALAERPSAERRRTRLVSAPSGYVAGEETAAVHFVNDGIALPTAAPPRPYEKGVGGRPTLVQNVESLAHVALIARYGDDWFRSLGHGTAAGTVLLTLSGAVPQPGVVEVGQGIRLGEVIPTTGWARGQAILLGGYFGGWLSLDDAGALTLDSVQLRSQGRSLGCGVVAVLPEGRCGVMESARIVGYLAGESAQQCGPCVFGLRAIASAVSRIAACRSQADDLARIQRWTGELAGRGACRHPDGAAGFLKSALGVFAAEFQRHDHLRQCSADDSAWRAAS